MEIKVNENCIGCGACQAIAPDVFEINDIGVAEVKENVNIEKLDETVKNDVVDAIEGCPVSAITAEEDK